MPFLSDKEMQVAIPKAIGDDAIEGLDDDFISQDKLDAAFRVENEVGSAIAATGGLPDSYATNPDFNPIELLTDNELLDERFVHRAALADNTLELEALRDQDAQEQSDREKIESGAMLEVAIAAIASPITFIPFGGAAYKTYRGGSSILKGALVTAGASASGASVSEAALHYTQTRRTYGESAINVTAAALLGGILGATPIGVRKLLEDAGHDPDAALKDIEQSMNPEQAINEGGNPAFAGDLRNAGAAEADLDIHVRGKAAKKATEILGFDPLSRTITSPLKETRIASNKLSENPIDMDRNFDHSTESIIKTKSDGILFESMDANEKFFVEWKKAGGKGSRRDFNEIVGKAVRNGSDDPIVQKAADSADRIVYAPGLSDAVEVKLLPEDIQVKTAKNYLNRLWRKEKIADDLPRFLSITSKWLLGVEPGLERLEADSLAKEIAGVIMSRHDGRLPYDYKIGEVAKKGGLTNLPGAPKGEFKARSFNIPDELMEDFLENDIELLMSRYVKNTVPDIELIKAYDDVNMSNVLKDIEQGWIEKIKKETDPKVRRKLNRKKLADLRDMNAMRDRIRGIYNIPDADNIWVRMGRVSKDLNYMRLLGGVVAASIPDVGKIIMAEGIVNTFRFGLKPLVRNLDTFKMSAREAKLGGVGTDGLMGGRAEIIADVADYAAGGTAFERGVRSAATKFSSINLMNQWTGGVKQLHAVMMQTRITNDLLKGVYDKRLGQLGISQADSTAIAAQLKAHGKKIDGVWVTNTKDWTNPDLVMMWRAAIRKDSDRVIIVPGQEKPLFMSTQMGSVVGQFKTFMYSATQRILISNLQAQDKHMMQGMIGLVSLGMMSYTFKQWDAGREITDDPMTMVVEGIDRSGMLGILMEANNMIEKLSEQSIGLRPALGVDAPASRFASRNIVGAAVGPTFGLLGDAVRVAGVAAKGEIKASDIRAARRIVPLQNLSFLRQGIDKLEAEVVDALGVPK